MKESKAKGNPPQPPTGSEEPPAHRSGAVARMLRMPVATLRVWERRYGLTQPALSPSGQRLYSADDVRRLALIKQLTDLGHAIGSLANLTMVQLQRVAATQTQAATDTGADEGSSTTRLPADRAKRLAVVGASLGARLQRPSVLRRLGQAVVLLGPFDNVAQAGASLRDAEVDALLIHEPQLHDGWLASFDRAAPALMGVPKAVLYGFASDPVCEALATAGTALLREPQPDAVIAQWLHGLVAGTKTAPATTGPVSPRGVPIAGPVPPRRWDDAALASFAGLSSTIACECPRHVAELLMQLSHFEAYSAECEHRHAADAELHTYLRHVAAASRARFEAALEHVALHEGLMLPLSTTPRDLAARPGKRRR